MLQGKSVAAQPQWPPDAGLGVDALGVELSEPLLELSDFEPDFLPPPRTPVYFGGAFLGVGSSVPVGGGLAAELAVG